MDADKLRNEIAKSRKIAASGFIGPVDEALVAVADQLGRLRKAAIAYRDKEHARQCACVECMNLRSDLNEALKGDAT